MPIPAVLLPPQASTIDPSNQDDLAFIWGVQYCLRLSAAHSQRLAAAVRELLADPRALRDQAGDAGTAAVLERVLRGWVEGAPRGVAEVEEERRRLLAARLSTKAGRRVSTAEDMRAVYQGQAEAAVASVLPWPRRGSSDVCLSNPVSGGRGAAMPHHHRCCYCDYLHPLRFLQSALEQFVIRAQCHHPCRRWRPSASSSS